MSSTYLNRSRNRYRRAVKVAWYKDFTLMIKILPPAFLLIVSVIALLVLSAGTPDSSEGKNPNKEPGQANFSLDVSQTTSGDTSTISGVELPPVTADDRFGWDLLLVNTEHPLPEGYQPSELVTFGPGKAQCDARIKEELEKMLNDAAAAGYPVSAISDYRAIEKQQELYDNKVADVTSDNPQMTRLEAEAEAAKTVAYPGTSEHHTGLAFDIASEGYFDLTKRFAESPAFQWLKEHCADYGFVIRYAEDKEHLTGVIYEPWHYRYVGKQHAKEMETRGLCLEEYIDYLESLGGGTPGESSSEPS